MFEIVQEIKDFGLYLENCISQEDIDELLELSKSELLERGTSRLGSHVVIHEGSEWHEYLKKYNNQEDGEDLKISKAAFKKIHPVMVKAMEIYTNHFGLDINKYTMSKQVYWIKTYDIGAFIGYHSDSWDSDGETIVPAVSIVLYLSSDFEGGELVFVERDDLVFVDSESVHKATSILQKNNDIVIKPSAGHVAIFDANAIHKVNAVISGTRISTDITYLN
jgi:predicted 2-oxoglutarate/Fe(II)-dependent dioxygenase YbiX